MKNDPCGIDSRSFHISWGRGSTLDRLGPRPPCLGCLEGELPALLGRQGSHARLATLEAASTAQATAAAFLPGKLSSASCSIRSMTRRAIWFASLTLRNRRTFPLPERFGMPPMEPQSWKGGKGGRSKMSHYPPARPPPHTPPGRPSNCAPCDDPLALQVSSFSLALTATGG